MQSAGDKKIPHSFHKEKPEKDKGPESDRPSEIHDHGKSHSGL